MAFRGVRRGSVRKVAGVLAAFLWAASATAAEPPSSSAPVRRGNHPTSGAVVYVEHAVIDRISPGIVVPGEPMMVTLTVQLATPISQTELTDALEVLVDAVEAQPLERQAATGGARPSWGELEPVRKFGVTLRAVAPSTLSEVVPEATVSVYSQLDSREIAWAIVPIAAPAETPGIVPNPLSVGLALAAVVAIGLVAVIQRRVSRRRIGELESLVQAERHRVSQLGRASSLEDSPTSLDDASSSPDWPDEVLSSLRHGELVLVLGPGASAQSGLPTSRSLWLDVLDRCAPAIPVSHLEELRAMVANEGPDAAAEPIVSVVGRDAVLTALREELMGTNARPSRFHELLAQLPVHAVLDMNWDDLMARALAQRAFAAFGPARQEGLSEALRAGQYALLKPFGDLREPQGVVLTEREYRRMLTQAPELERSIAGLFSTQTLLFFGFSLHGLEQFLGRLPAQLESGSRRHFAVVPAGAGRDLWEAGLGRRYGVALIRYRPSPDYHELVTATEALVDAAPAPTRSSDGPAAQMSLRSSRLTRIELRSIGVFRELKLDFTPGWTLLLGNNGGGKSTILRAIAMALAGNDPRTRSAAARLLRTGESKGSIALGFGNANVITELVRDNQAVVVHSPQVTALQAGHLLVLGFPALRGVTTAQVRGATHTTPPDPSVDDVAPLLEGVVDSRLDNLKQWVVNTALRAEKAPSGREASMFRTFQRLIAEMVPGGGLEFSHVDRQTFQVVLKAPYGEVSFDGVSQGMSSILNWIGVLLERLYDVYPRSDQPEHELAIVLVDEIDAHLHPRWQRQLVRLTRDHFPNVQIIASSHSPLLAGAVEHSELRVVAPNEETGEIEARVPSEDISGQKAEDILVSSVFSLETTRSVDAERTIQRYFELFEKESLTAEEREELASLSEQLRLLNYGPTSAERVLMEQVRGRVDTDLANVSVAATLALKQRLESLREVRRASGPEEPQA